MKSIIKFFWVPIVLCACVGNAGQTASNQTPTNLQAKVAVAKAANPDENIFTVGGTYDSMSMHPTNYTTCLNIGNNPANIEILNPHALIKLDSIETYSSVMNALGLEFTAKFGWGAFSKTVSYQYARTSQDDNYTLNLNYIYQFAGKAVLNKNAITFGNAALIPSARAIVDSDPVGFRRMCGDKYVSTLNAGVSLLMRVSIKFNSHSEKNKFEADFSKETGLNSVLNAIKYNNSGVNYQVTLSGIQVGGKPEELNKYFAEYSDETGVNGYPEITCGSNGNIKADCTQIINKVMGYADTLSSQLNTPNDYHLYNPTVEPWSNLEIHPGAVNPDSTILGAMEDLSKQYVKDQDNLTFLIQYSNMLGTFNLLSATMKDSLQTLILSYRQVVDVYLNPANKVMNCYNGFVSTQCVTIRNSIFKEREQILNNSSLNELLQYLQSKEYMANLAIGINEHGNINKTNCAILPISEQLFAQYLIDCDGQVSGTLDTNKSLIIRHEPINNMLQISNFNYSYKTTSTSVVSNFSYSITQPLIRDIYHSNVWRSSQVPILLNQNNWNWGELIMVNPQSVD
jgi:hypothetical protein